MALFCKKTSANVTSIVLLMTTLTWTIVLLVAMIWLTTPGFKPFTMKRRYLKIKWHWITYRSSACYTLLMLRLVQDSVPRTFSHDSSGRGWCSFCSSISLRHHMSQSIRTTRSIQCSHRFDLEDIPVKFNVRIEVIFSSPPRHTKQRGPQTTTMNRKAKFWNVSSHFYQTIISNVKLHHSHGLHMFDQALTLQEEICRWSHLTIEGASCMISDE